MQIPIAATDGIHPVTLVLIVQSGLCSEPVRWKMPIFGIQNTQVVQLQFVSYITHFLIEIYVC